MIFTNPGVNSHMEMANAFFMAGFSPTDVHMSDLMNGFDLCNFAGLACPGGFSYGDVLGAGAGWAKSAVLNTNVAKSLRAFFARPNTFAIGICNGCQMLSQLVSVSGNDPIIPGTSHWPTFQRNTSEQFEARMSLVKVNGLTNSIFLKGMQNAILPIATSHGEGRAEFKLPGDLEHLFAKNQIAVQYVKSDETIAGPNDYPYNPNGSEQGIAAVSSLDGRVLAIMPHPERVVKVLANSWGKSQAGWRRLFQNALLWHQQF